MFDRELVLADLTNILWALDQISKRFAVISSAEDFIRDDTGLEKLDSICMQLINIGEVLKQIDKLTAGELLAHYSEVDWKKVKGLRDIITHHYFDVDAETIFSVCSVHLAPLRKQICIIKSCLEEME
jgi:uncharacterized protein with HEPN domain